MSRPIDRTARPASEASSVTPPTSGHVMPGGGPVKVPAELIQKLGLRRGDRISISFQGHVMLVHDAKGRLLGRVTPESHGNRIASGAYTAHAHESASY